MSMSDWLKEMLAKRGCKHPDGRWLYAYRLTSDEYKSLRKLLSDAVRVNSVRELARWNHSFAPLFVLYAAEWWRREYDGGAWKWGPIFESLGIAKNSLSPNERTGMVFSGFAYYGVSPTGDGKRYFGAVVAQGGLPLKFIGHRGGKLASIMAVVLRQAGLYRWGESQLVDAVEDHADRLPDSLRQREVYQLIAKMVLTALSLKQQFGLDGLADPVGQLDRVHQDWRFDFPLPVDDDAAKQLLLGLVKAANEVSISANCLAFAVKRVLRPVDDEVWSLESSVVHPATLPVSSLVAQFGLPGVDLPRYFDVDVSLGRRIGLTSGRQILGMEEATVSLSPQRRRWDGLHACEEHQIFLRASGAGGDLHEGPISVPGGEAVPLDEPLIFADRENEFRLVGTGNLRLPDQEVLIAVPQDAKLEMCNHEVECPVSCGRLLLDELELLLFRAKANALIRRGEDTWSVSLGQTSSLSSSYVLEGRRVGYRSRPWPVFRGIPRVVRYAESGERTVVSSGIKLFVAGTNREVGAESCRGPVDLCVFKGTELLARFRCVVIAKNSSEKFVSCSTPTEGLIEIFGWGASDLALGQREGLVGRVSDGGEQVVLSLAATPVPPDVVMLTMRWQGCKHELLVWLPFPASGGHAFDARGHSIESGCVMPLARVAETKIVIFDQNPNSPKRYEVELKLHGDVELARQYGATVRWPVRLEKGRAVVRLLDLYPDIEALLGFSEELDASVRLTLNVGGHPDFSMSVSRYDAVLEPKCLSLSLGVSDLSRFLPADLEEIRVQALPLTKPASPIVVLKQIHAEGVPTGRWEISDMDSRHSPWLVFPAAESSVKFRPVLVAGGVQSVTTDELTDETNSPCPLAEAIAITDARLRREVIESVLESMAADFKHASWALLDGIWSAFGKLPLCSIDVFKILAARPELVAAMLLRSHLPLPELLDHVRQLKRQLGLVLELAAVRDWRDGVLRLHDYWVGLIGEEAVQLSFKIVLKEKLSAIGADFPSIQLLMDLLVFEAIGEASQELVNVQQRKAAEPAAYLSALWKGGGSLLQRMLLLVNADDERWPEPFFVRDEALPALLRLIDRSLVMSLQRFFWLESDDFKLSVANMPVICAVWSVLGLGPAWWSNSARRFALRRLRRFNPLWFEEAYRHIFASCITFGLLTPATPRLLRPTTAVPQPQAAMKGARREPRVLTIQRRP